MDEKTRKSIELKFKIEGEFSIVLVIPMIFMIVCVCISIVG